MLVTSHDMADIVTVCNDLIVIDHGNVVFKGPMNQVADIHGRRRFIDVELSQNVTINDERIRILNDNGRKKTFVVDLENISIDKVIGFLTKNAGIEDMQISSTPIEDIIKEIYNAK